MDSEVNYLRIKRLSLCNVDYIYLDHESHMADSLFIQNEVQVKFLGEFKKKNSEWEYVRCRINKKDIDQFKDALTRLHDKCRLCGIKGYSAALAHMHTMFVSVM